MAEDGRVTLRAERSRQLAASQKTWPSVLHCRELNSTDNQQAQKRPPGLRWLGSPSNPLISAWWDPEQGAKPTSAVGLTHEKCWRIDIIAVRGWVCGNVLCSKNKIMQSVNYYLCTHPPFPLVAPHSVCPHPGLSHHHFHISKIVIPPVWKKMIL